MRYFQYVMMWMWFFLSSMCQVHVFELVKRWNVGIFSFLCIFFFKDNFNLWCLLLIIVFYYQTKIPLGNDWNPDLLFETKKKKKKNLLIELIRIHFCVYVYAKLWDICLSHLAIWHTKWHKNFFFFKLLVTSIFNLIG